MSLLERRLKSKSITPLRPDWVSDKNITWQVYDLINELRESKLASFKTLTIRELKAKKNYQISAGDLSRLTGIAKTTLISTSSYSKALREYLLTVNNELAAIRDARVQGYIANQHSVKQRKKNVIIEENKKIKEAYEMLLKQNASEQVKLLLSRP